MMQWERMERGGGFVERVDVDVDVDVDDQTRFSKDPMIWKDRILYKDIMTKKTWWQERDNLRDLSHKFCYSLRN